MSTGILTTKDWHEPEIDDLNEVDAAPVVAKAREHLTLGGWILFAAGALVFMSGYSEYRPRVGNLSLHPYQFPLVAAFPLLALVRLHKLPVQPMIALVVFGLMYIFSTLPGGLDLGESAKIVSSLICIASAAMLVRGRRDFVAGTLGLLISVSGLAFVALSDIDTETGHIKEILDSGNKNAYSLFALPAILLAGYVIVRQKQATLVIKAAMVIGIIACLLGIFTSANRSGYLGAVVIAALLLAQPAGWEMVLWIVAFVMLLVMKAYLGGTITFALAGVFGGLRLLYRTKLLGVFMVLCVAGLVAGYLLSNRLTATFDRRIEQTQQGIDSDQLRLALVVSAVKIALSHPVLGVSPEQIPWELGNYVQLEFGHSYIDSHNVFGHIAAASGLICFAAFVAAGILFATWNPYHKPLKWLPQPFCEARQLMQMMLFLYLVRGLFTREILYNPGFIIALGLNIGLMMHTSEEKIAATHNHEEYEEYEAAIA